MPTAEALALVRGDAERRLLEKRSLDRSRKRVHIQGIHVG